MNIDLASIGQILKEKRVERGLSVAQVAETLCLRKSLIDAIEAGNWEPLPHEVYVKGFVKEYAGLLRAQKDIGEYLADPGKVVTMPETPAPEEVIRPVKTQARPRRFLRAKFAVLVVLGIVMFIFAYDRMEKEKTVAAKSEKAAMIAQESGGEATTGSSVRAVSEVTSGTGEGGTLTTTIGEPKRLMITCHERTWISVVIDGTEKKEFMLSPQEIIVLNAKETFDLLVGNAGGVKLLLNGKDTEFTGRSGEVKRIQLS